MLRLFLFRFWPVFIPLVIYWLWWHFIGRKATIDGKPLTRFRDGPWYWAVLTSLLIAVGCFIFLGKESIQGGKGAYIPPHMENGTLVPAQVQKP
jgi:hypothetical protein